MFQRLTQPVPFTIVFLAIAAILLLHCAMAVVRFHQGKLFGEAIRERCTIEPHTKDRVLGIGR